MISIVIPLYNKEKSIASTIESVLAQTCTDWELIIVNDGSTDNSLRVIYEFVRKFGNERIRVIYKENGGVCSARNRGIQEARSEYVALLDADDLWDNDFLLEQMRMVADFPEAVMWGINYAETYNGKLVRYLETGLPKDYRGYVDNYFQMPTRVSDLFCSSSVLIRKSVFNQVGLFDERIKYAEDTDMWFRIIATNRVAFYDRCMVKYRYEAENRALNRERKLDVYLPYFVDKYQTPLYKNNKVFYPWINKWSANRIRFFYFSNNRFNILKAKEAAAKLDYSVLPFKYRFLFGLPYRTACILNKIDLYRRKEL